MQLEVFVLDPNVLCPVPLSTHDNIRQFSHDSHTLCCLGVCREEVPKPPRFKTVVFCVSLNLRPRCTENWREVTQLRMHVSIW